MQMHVYLDMKSVIDKNVSVWINLARAHQAVLATIEKSLKAAGFDVV